MSSVVSKFDKLANFSFDNVKKSFFGYNVDQVNSRARMLYNDYSSLQKDCEDLTAKYNAMKAALEEKEMESYEVHKTNDILESKLAELQLEVENLTVQLKDANEKILFYKQMTEQNDVNDYKTDIRSEQTSSVSEDNIDDDDILVGDVEDKVSDKFLIGDGEDADEGFSFV